MSVRVLTGDCRDVLPTLAAGSVHCVVTSPPYFGLRSYLDAGHDDKHREIGAEPTPDEFVAALVEVFGHVRRVLRDDGVCWLNLGSSYGPDGNELGIPWRTALALQQDGWTLRQAVVWAKCLSGGATVYVRSQKGDMPMMVKDLVRLDPATVQLWSGERWTQAVAWQQADSRDGALEIELRSGERIGCTPDHRWPTQRGNVEARDLAVGDVIPTTTIPEPDEPKAPAGLPDDDVGWFVGLYLAEGSRYGWTLSIASHTKETARLERCRRIAAAYGGTCNARQSSENGMVIQVESRVLSAVVDQYMAGRVAKDKHLTTAAWQRCNGFLRALMEGYLSGDGAYDAKNDRWRIRFTNNDALASDMRTLAARLGAKISLRRGTAMMGDRAFPCWRGEWRWKASDKANARQSGEIVAIRKSRARKLWDIAVADEPHLFALASGVLTHNSSPMPESVAGTRWERCRVKVGEGNGGRMTPKQADGVDGGLWQRPGPGLHMTGWQDGQHVGNTYAPCPGCPRCAANDGYVLRRGSWRHTSATEMVFMLTKGMQYWADQEAVREPNSANSHGGQPIEGGPKQAAIGQQIGGVMGLNFTGRNPRNWVTPSPSPFPGAHFATFPPSLIEPFIKATCPAKCCPTCGAGWAVVVERETVREIARANGHDPAALPAYAAQDNRYNRNSEPTSGVNVSNGQQKSPNVSVLGYRPTCSCPLAAPVPGTCLDPFAGAGTTLLVADRLGLNAIGIELNPAYAEMAERRIYADAPLFAEAHP